MLNLSYDSISSSFSENSDLDSSVLEEVDKTLKKKNLKRKLLVLSEEGNIKLKKDENNHV